VPERTAQRWAEDRNVRREVDACRRRALNQAIGRLTGMARNAVDGIAHLGKGADSESVQLRAWRGVLADLMSVSKFSVLEYRMTEIEEQLDKRGQGDPGAPEILQGLLILLHRKRKSSWKSYNQGICGSVPSARSLRGMSA
jgi:hypothetical protein